MEEMDKLLVESCLECRRGRPPPSELWPSLMALIRRFLKNLNYLCSERGDGRMEVQPEPSIHLTYFAIFTGRANKWHVGGGGGGYFCATESSGPDAVTVITFPPSRPGAFPGICLSHRRVVPDSSNFCATLPNASSGLARYYRDGL